MAVSMMKDEAPFLLEWFAHHLAVGFTDILVYTNDCTDGTVEMLQRLEELGLGYHRANVIPEGVKPQPSALNHAQNEPLVQDADWVMVFDADEFLAINHPSGTLDGMLDDAVARDANGIIVTWRIFGSNGVVDWSRAPVTEQYTRAAPPDWNKGWGVKTLFKFDPEYWKLGIHRPSIKNKHLEDGFPDTVRWLNGSGKPMEEYFRFHGWRSITRTIGYDWAQMNHYAVKSVDSYALRKFRGNVNNKADKYNAGYWALQDRNEVPDTRILRHAPARAAIMTELLTDPVLRDLHETALARVEARLADYRQSDAYRALRDSLIEAGRVPISSVEAKPPKARDPIRIAELMGRMKRPKDGAEERGRPIPTPSPGPYVIPVDLSSEPEGEVEWAENHGVLLPGDFRIFSTDAVTAVLAGKFDRRNARNLPGQVAGMARLLDLGGGLGFPAMVALRNHPGLVVMLQENRPGLAAAARMIHRRNGFEDGTRLKLVEGPLRLPSDGPAEAAGLAACLRDFRPDALRLSQPEAVPPDLLAAMPLDSVRRVIVVAEDEALRPAFSAALLPLGFEDKAPDNSSGALLFGRK